MNDSISIFSIPSVILCVSTNQIRIIFHIYAWLAASVNVAFKGHIRVHESAKDALNVALLLKNWTVFGEWLQQQEGRHLEISICVCLLRYL